MLSIGINLQSALWPYKASRLRFPGHNSDHQLHFCLYSFLHMVDKVPTKQSYPGFVLGHYYPSHQKKQVLLYNTPIFYSDIIPHLCISINYSIRLKKILLFFYFICFQVFIFKLYKYLFYPYLFYLVIITNSQTIY